MSSVNPRFERSTQEIRRLVRGLSADALRRRSSGPPVRVHLHADEAPIAPAIAGVLDAPASRRRYLRLISPEALARVLEACGFIEYLHGLGYQPQLVFDLDHPLGDRLRVEDADWGLLVDVRAHPAREPLPGELRSLAPPPFMELLKVEWITMRHPRGSFSADRPRLPGQEHPGLGMGGQVVELLRLGARALGAEGLAARPRCYHAAEIYSRGFYFVDPRHQGWLEALRRDLAQLPLAERAWAFEEGRVIETGAGQAFAFWEGLQVMPLVRRLRGGFGSRRYRKRVRAAAEALAFDIREATHPNEPTDAPSGSVC